MIDLIVTVFISIFLAFGGLGLIFYFLSLFEQKKNNYACIRHYKDSAIYYTIAFITFIITLILLYIYTVKI